MNGPGFAVDAGESAFHICTSASNQSLVLAKVRELFLTGVVSLYFAACRGQQGHHKVIFKKLKGSLPTSVHQTLSSRASPICTYRRKRLARSICETFAASEPDTVGLYPDSRRKTGVAEHLDAFENFSTR